MALRTTPKRSPDEGHRPRARRKDRKRRGFFRRFWWLFVVVPLVFIVGTAGTLAYIYVKLPLPSAPAPAQTTYLYDSSGDLLTTLHAEVDRTIIPLVDMPEHLREAVIATEDKDFYEHPGISVTAILRAAWADLTNREIVQGGSTITQQYVKNVFTEGERSVVRKIKEAMLALKLENELTKDEILAEYLNTIYFGQGAYGVQAAARTYFDKDAQELSILESATLAGVITAPSRFDPVRHPEDSTVRRNYVLDRMAEEGYITADRAELLKGRPVQTAPQHTRRAPAAYFVTETKRWLERVFGEEDTFGGGFRVHTTLRMDWQRAAEEAVATYLSGSKDQPSAALVAIDPRNGAVRAMVGDARYLGRTRIGRINLAVRGRQPGSAFKVFTLAAAMEDGISLSSIWSGPPEIPIEDPRCATPNEDTGELEPWTPENAGDSGAGTMSLLSATAYSVNTIFAQLVVQVDPVDVAEVAHRMGIGTPLDPVCAITLGSEDVTVLDMATAYGTLANQGIRHEPRYVSRITDPDGTLVLRPRPDAVHALNPNDAALVTYALQGAVERGTGTAAAIGRPVAGKTGTAQDNTNAYFCGYVPQLVACVWVGYPEGNIPMEDVAGFPAVYGGTIPARIWHDFMVVATQGMPVEEFPEPSFEGYDLGNINPPALPSPSPSPTPTETPTPEPTESPTPEPTESPIPTETPTTPPPTTEPPPTVEPPPTPSPSPGEGEGLAAGDGTGTAWAMIGALLPASLVAGGLRFGRRARRARRHRSP